MAKRKCDTCGSLYDPSKEGTDTHCQDCCDTYDEDADVMRCSLCNKPINPLTAHLHQGEYIGEECCWDDRLKASE
ncbi:MAG: hypothetical protein M0036_14150 [Desulfobacteraceae bacterium]|nr:hypothetical protein [Desulfobacteraceae bacterium]